MAASSQPPATAPPMTLVTLPDDLALSILVRVPCKDDRASMSLVCKAWRHMVARLSARAERRPLPWLLLPSRFRNDTAFFRAACVLSGCRVHPQHRHLTVLPLAPGARFAGSYDGAWIFLHYGGQARAHALFNLRTGQSRALPSVFSRPNDDGWVDNMFILAATLSSSPDDPRCIGAAIVAAWRDPDPYAIAMPGPLLPHRRFLVFWRMEWAVATEMALGGAANHAAVYHVEDVVHHGGAFHALVNYGDHNHILVCRQAGRKHQGTWRWMRSESLLFRPDERIYGYGQFLRSRYIVASRGELLKVMRWKPRHDQPTSMFKVFRATKRPQMPADADFPVAAYPWVWSELDTLDGRILFVGYGCSRSYDAAKYPGFEAGIYFLDDGKFYDEAVFFRNHNIRPYPCSDNGKWSEGSVQLCFPTADPSEHSPPVWLLP